MEYKDYYKLLGVSREATAEEIKKAFRKLARQYHPDVAKDKAGAEAKFKEINEAYEVLSDPGKRKKYDQLGANWKHYQNTGEGGPQGRRRSTAEGGEFHFGGTGFSDFFEQFFGRGFGGGSTFDGGGHAGPASRGSDVEGELMVTLEEAMKGCLRPITIRTSDPRTGQVRERTIQFRVPSGVADGQRIRLAGQGEVGVGGGGAGDVYLNIRYSHHPEFRVENSDLYYDLELAPWEALLGGRVTVPGLLTSVKLNIAPYTRQGTQLRLKGKGMPKGKAELGDFYAVVRIQIPNTITPEERDLWEKLAKISRFNPRAEGASSL